MTTYPGAIDSGLLIVGDPAYILDTGHRNSPYKFGVTTSNSLIRKTTRSLT